MCISQVSNTWLKQIYVQHWLDILVFLSCCPVLGRKCSLKTAKVGPKDKLFQVKAQRKWGSVVSDQAHQTALPQPCGTAAPSDFSQLWIMEVELAMNSSIPAFCVSNSQKTSHVEQAEQCAVFSFNSKQIKYGPHPVSPIVDTGFLLTSAELVTTLLLLKSVNFVHWVVWHFV